MALEGGFKDFGLADIFQLVGLQKKTGVLTVRGEGGRLVTVSFENGTIVFADEFNRSESERLGAVLLRTRHLTREQLAGAMEIQKSTAQRLGHILVEQKFVSQTDLATALQLQVKETVYQLFRWREGSYHFSAETVTFDRDVYVPLPTELVLMEGVRMIDEWPIIEKKIPNLQVVFAQVAGAAPTPPVGAHPAGVDMEDLISVVDDDEPAAVEPGARPAQGAALGSREKVVLELVDGVRTVQEIVDFGRLGEFETCRVLYGLLSLGLIRIRDSADQATTATAAKTAKGAAKPRVGGGHGEYALAAVAVLLALALMLFNPWGFLSMRFRASRGRSESAAIADAVRLRRVRLALEVYLLEKQAYPPGLEQLVESGLLKRRELHGTHGASFIYHGGDREYRLDREERR